MFKKFIINVKNSVENFIDEYHELTVFIAILITIGFIATCIINVTLAILWYIIGLITMLIAVISNKNSNFDMLDLFMIIIASILGIVVLLIFVFGVLGDRYEKEIRIQKLDPHYIRKQKIRNVI